VQSARKGTPPSGSPLMDRQYSPATSGQWRFTRSRLSGRDPLTFLFAMVIPGPKRIQVSIARTIVVSGLPRAIQPTELSQSSVSATILKDPPAIWLSPGPAVAVTVNASPPRGACPTSNFSARSRGNASGYKYVQSDKRMKRNNATKFHRKSGVAQWRACRFRPSTHEILTRNAEYDPPEEVSSRPERSEVEGPAVSVHHSRNPQ
jgi:hypothetical protein